MRHAEILEKRFDARACKNAARAQTATLRHAVHLRRDVQSADFRRNIRQFAALARNHAAGNQRCLVQHKRVVGIVALLQVRNCREFPTRAHIRAFQHDHRLRQTAHMHLHGILSAQQNRGIEHRSALFVAVRRRIAPAAAPVDPQRQTHRCFFFHWLMMCAKPRAVRCRARKHHALNFLKSPLDVRLSFLRITQYFAEAVEDSHPCEHVRRCRLFRNQAALIGADGSILKNFLRFLDCAAAANHRQEVLDLHGFAQVRLPFQNRRRVRAVERAAQADALRRYPRVIIPRAHCQRVDIQRRIHRFRHRIADRVDFRLPQRMVIPIPHVPERSH